MAHIRDIRPHARELKFVVKPELAGPIRQWARAHLDPDIHGGGPNADEYRTTTVYFDTEALDVFHRRGSFGRSKYRIRRYGADETVFLERKMRQPAVLAKRRTTVALADLPRLDGVCGPRLDAADGDDGWAGRWFERRVGARRLRPVCEVAYTRMARAVMRDGEPVRLTLDANLRARAASEARFRDEANVPASVALPELILELKYRDETPALFRQLVEEFALTPRSSSKFRLGVAATGQSVAPAVMTDAARSGTAFFYA